MDTVLFLTTDEPETKQRKLEGKSATDFYPSVGKSERVASM